MNYYESPPGIPPKEAARRLRISVQMVRVLAKKLILDRVFTGKSAGPHPEYLITDESIKRYQAEKKRGTNNG